MPMNHELLITGFKSCRQSISYLQIRFYDSVPWRFSVGFDDEPKAPVEAPSSPNYVPGPEHTPSPDYVLGPEEPEQAPLSPNYVPEPQYPKCLALEQASPPLSPAYVPEPVYLEYLAPSDDDILVEYQPLPADASPTALSPGYIADFDPGEDPEEDPADNLANGGDDDDESFDNDDDANDDDDDEGDEEEEEEHPALADSSTVPAIDPVPQLGIQRHSRWTTTTKALIAEYASAPTPPSPLTLLSSPFPQIPSPPLPLPSPPTHTSTTYAEAPLGYRAARIRLRAASPLPLPTPSSLLPLPATGRMEDVHEADVPPRKRADYSFVDTVDASIRAAEERAMAVDDRAAVRAEIEDANDYATEAMMRIHVLEARACIDTLEDTGSSA
ncbi:hypothetical protein Tco_0666714 [Tanacetum coccineum]